MEQLKLNMIPNGVNPVFHASQYDKGRQIRFVIDETLSGAEVTTSYRAKDGTEYGNVQTSVSGNTITDTIPEEVLTDYGIIEGEVNIDGIGSLNFFVEVEKDAYDGGVITTQTASGPIATFETNIETALVSLKSDINPLQDLHGYSKPWSGGGGKNKLNCTATTETRNGVTLTVVKNSANQVTQINVTGTATAGVSFMLGTATIEAGTYVLNGYTGGSSVGTKYINYSGIANAYGSNVTSTISETKTTTASLQIANGAETGFTIYPMIRLSNTSADYEPYSNICPISGFSALNVTRTGKNLVDFLSHLRASASGLTISATSDGAIHYQGTATAAYSQLTSTFNQSIKSGTTITFSRDRVLNHQQYLDLTFTDNTHDYLRIQANETSKTYTFAKDLKSIEMVCLGLSVGTTYDETVKFMVELGSTATDFDPYNGQTATVNFGQTVYGGQVDVTGGSVVSEWGYFTIPTIANYNTSGGHNYTYNTPTGMIVEGGTHFDLIAEAIASNGTLGDKFTMYRINNGVVIGVPDNFTVADYNSQIAGTHLLYPLATPIEISTTPETLTAIVGQNNVFSDTNGDTEVEYYIEV